MVCSESLDKDLFIDPFVLPNLLEHHRKVRLHSSFPYQLSAATLILPGNSLVRVPSLLPARARVVRPESAAGRGADQVFMLRKLSEAPL